MTNTKQDADKSLFVYVKDVNTDKIRRVAMPHDMQVGMLDNPAELQLLGRLSLASTSYNISRQERSEIFVSNHDTIVAVSLTNSPDDGRIKLYLPTAPRNGQLHFIKDVSGTSNTVPIDILTSDGSTIDGQLSGSLNDNYGSRALYWYQDRWHVLVAGVGLGSMPAASFITAVAEPTLSGSRRAVAGTGITITDNGSNSTIVWSLSEQPTPGTSLDNLQWLLPRLSDFSSTVYNCPASSIVSGTMSGISGALYYVTLRFRGVVEQKSYTGGRNDGAYWQEGGSPAADDFNIYSMTVSDPPSTYYLNRGTSGLFSIFAIDYTKTIPIRAGALVTLTALSIDSQEIANNGSTGGPLSISGISSPTQPYAGQFIVVNHVTSSASGSAETGRIFVRDDGYLLSGTYSILNFTTGVNAEYAGTDTANITIDNSIVATISGSRFTGPVIAAGGLSGSLQRLASGETYLVAGANVTITSASNGQVTISSTGGGGGGADVSASYLVIGNTGSLPNERMLSAGSGISLTDNGPGGTLVISATGGGGGSGAVGGTFNYITASTTSRISTTSSSWQQINELTFDITSSGYPIMLIANVNYNPNPGWARMTFFRSDSSGQQNLGQDASGLCVVDGSASENGNANLIFIDAPAAGGHRYWYAVKQGTGGNGEINEETDGANSIRAWIGGIELKAPFNISSSWIDGGGKLRTTSSVSIDGDGGFASDKGTDVFFYVSGTQGIPSGTSNQRSIAVFGGDVRISGSVTIGTGSVTVTSNDIQFGSFGTRIEKSTTGLKFFDASNPNGRTLSSLGGGGSNDSSGPSSARPAASGEGKLYFCDDIPVVYFDDPSTGTWRQFLLPSATPGPSTSSYTATGNLAMNQLADVIYAAVSSSAIGVGSCALAYSGSLSGSVPWTVELECSFHPPYNTTFPEVGVCVSNGTTSGVSNAWVLAVWQNGTSWGLHQEQIGVGSLGRIAVNNEVLTSPQPFTLGDGRMRLRLVYDTTNLHYQYSNDGYTWYDWYTATVPASLTHWGFTLGQDYSVSGNALCKATIYKNTLNNLTVVSSSITNATNTNPIVVTTAEPHQLMTGDMVAVHGVGGNTAANTGTGSGNTAGAKWINVLSSTTFQLIDTAGNGAYTSGGQVFLISR